MIRIYLLLLAAGVYLSAPPEAHAQIRTFAEKQKKPAVTSTVPFEYVQIPKPSTTASRSRLAARPASPGLARQLKLRIVRDTQTGQPIYIENKEPKAPPVAPGARPNARASAMQFLKEIESVLALTKSEQEIEVQTVEGDELGQTHVRMRQMHLGVPIYGADLIAHLTKENAVQVINGRWVPTPKLAATTPSLTAEAALDKALEDVRTRTIVQEPAEDKGLILKRARPESELVIYYRNQRPDDEHLAWYLTFYPNLLERWVVVIDAHSGEVLHRYNHTCSVDGPVKATAKDLNGVSRALQTYQKGNRYYMIDASRAMFSADKSTMPEDPIGALWTIDAANTAVGDKFKVQQVTSTNNTNWNATAVSAHLNASLAYEYYLKTFNRNSLDGKGGTVISVINIVGTDGKGMDNAFWNGQFMGYGNGRVGFKPLAGGLDAAGHEMTHGVIQNTARLEYEGQSGAINESLADVFAVLIDRDDWTVGEDITKPAIYPSGAMRSMSNPNQGGKDKDPNGYQPMHMSQYITTEDDNGGVHDNSGIPNHAFYLFATAVGKDKAEKVYYRAMTTYLTRSSQFLDLRLAIVKSATDLFGATSAEVAAAKSAFDKVGVTEENGNPGTKPELPANPGKDLLLAVGSDNKLYQSSPEGTDIVLKTASQLKRKPSVTDDGQYAYYVTTDGRIRAVNLTGTPSEVIISDEPIWGNVTISKDGKKLAALRAEADAAIWVYSYDLKKWAKFPLFNPTYSDGITTGEVQYADAFEWDLTGQYLVYDAFNELGSSEGDAINYWDVGRIRVWNSARNTFGDGDIEKLFNDLEAGENIGNPSFAKNSNDVIAFDYINDNDNSYYVLGFNLETGELNAIIENTAIGHPGYSRLDDKLIFSTTNDKDESSIGVIGLEKDRITPVGEPALLLRNAKYAVWVAQGTRSLPTKTVQTITFPAVGDKTVGEAFTVKATASSGLPVTMAVQKGSATLTGDRLTLTGAGKITLRASQNGNEHYAASNLEQSFCSNPVRPTIRQEGFRLTASGTGGIFQWYRNNQPLTGSEAVLEVAEGGDYTVQVVTADGCKSAPATVARVVILSTEPSWTAGVNVYPNPASSGITVDVPAGVEVEQLSVQNLNGATLKQQVNGPAQSSGTLDVSALPKGMYLLRIQTSRAVIHRKVLKE